MKKMYRVGWYRNDIEDGRAYYGEWHENESTVKVLVDEGNRTFTNLTHFVDKNFVEHYDLKT